MKIGFYIDYDFLYPKSSSIWSKFPRFAMGQKDLKIKTFDLRKMEVPKEISNFLLYDGIKYMKKNFSKFEDSVPSKFLENFDLTIVVVTRDRIYESFLIGEALKREGYLLYQDPEELIKSHDKLLCIKKWKRLRLPVLETVGVNLNSLCGVAPKYLDKWDKIVVKTRMGGRGKEVFKIERSEEVENVIKKLQRHYLIGKFHEDVLVQKFYELDKFRGKKFDLRLTFTKIDKKWKFLGSYKRVAGERQWKTNISLGGKAFAHKAKKKEIQLSLKALKPFKIKECTLDLVPSKNKIFVSEINVNFGYGGLVQTSGVDPMPYLLESIKSTI